MKKIILFGDDLLAGYRDGEATDDVTAEVKQDVSNMGFPMNVENLSEIGLTTGAALDTLDVDNFGEADYWALNFNHEELAEAASIANLKKIITLIGAEKVILLTPSYQSSGKSFSDASYNAALMEFAKSAGVSHIDLAYHMAIYPNTEEFLVDDGIHFSKWGNELLGNLIARNIKIKEMALLAVSN